MPLFKRVHISANNLIIHTVCWILYIGYELFMVYVAIGSLENPLSYIIYYAINIVYFYTYVALLKYTFFNNWENVIKGLTGYLLLLAAYLYLKAVADQLLGSQPHIHKDTYLYNHQFLVRNLIRVLNFSLLGTFYWLATRISKLRERTLKAENLQLLTEYDNARLEIQVINYRNAFLQQQLSPHLLFNALNFVYNDIQKYSDDAAHCIWLLSEIMRYNLEVPAADGKVSLYREMEQLQNLIDINQFRFNYNFHVDYSWDGNCSECRIMPLLLLTITENVFKHGNITDKNCPAKIRVYADPLGKLTFYSKNQKKTGTVHYKDREHLGLKNLKIRMDMIYNGRYALEINDMETEYELTLTLQL